MQNITGAKAVGENFFDRIQEIELFWRDAETDNILLLAPRRVGKTSLMENVRAHAEEHGFVAAFVDVSDCPDELSFIQRIYEAILGGLWGDRLWGQIKGSWLGKTVERIEKIGGYGVHLEFRGDSVPWARLGEDLADAISRLEGRWLIQIDELPVFVLKLLGQGGEAERSRVREFLYWMRRIRLQYPGVRWMLAGSIGLDTVAARLNIADSINDLRIMNLDAFETETASAFLNTLAESYKIDLNAPVRDYLVTRVGWPIPYYLQLIFHELRMIRGLVTELDVDEAIKKLLNSSHRNYFDYWRQRLFDELGRADAELAILLLRQCCRAADGASKNVLKLAMARAISDPNLRADKQHYLLDVLQNDGYIVETQDSWRFRSPLLREYWLKRVEPSEESND